VVWACTLNANKAQQAIASNAGLTGFMKDPPKRIAVHLKPAKASQACSLMDSFHWNLQQGFVLGAKERAMSFFLLKLNYFNN